MQLSYHFIFSDALHHLYSVFAHFVSWRGILPFPEFSMGGVGASLFSTITLNFVCTVFTSSFSAMHLKFSCTFFFSYVYHLFLVPVFFLPDLIFFLLFFLNEIFQVVVLSLIIHKFTLSPFWLTSINSENRLFACNCPSGRKFRRILVVYNYLKIK